MMKGWIITHVNPVSLIFVLIVRMLSSNPVVAYYVETTGGTNNESAVALAPTMFNDQIVVGWTKSYGAESTDVFISKYDVLGNHLLTKVFRISQNDYPCSMIITSDGKILIVGYSKSFTWLDLFISKFDANLNHEWTRLFYHNRSEIGFSVVEVPNGNYIIAGLTYTGGFPDLLLTAFDANGDLQWQTAMANEYCSQANSATKTHDSAVVVTGFYAPNSSTRIPLISKFRNDGVHLWAKLMTLPYPAYGTAITETGDRNLAIAGVMFRPSSNTWDLFVAKFDSLGNNLWTRWIVDSRIDTAGIPVSICNVSANRLMVTGTTSRWGINKDILISMFDGGGGHIYSRVFGSDSLDKVSNIYSRGEGYLIVGSTKGWDAISQDILMATFYSDGHTCTAVDTIYPQVNNLFPTMDTLSPQLYNPSQTAQSWTPNIFNANPVSSFVCWEASGTVKEKQPARKQNK